MNIEQVKEELIKRYMYLYQNKELILSLCIHCGIEKKEIVKIYWLIFIDMLICTKAYFKKINGI